MFCKKCGYTLKENENVCPFCGQVVGEPVVMHVNNYKKVDKKVSDGIRNSLGFVKTNIKPIWHLIIGFLAYGLMNIGSSLVYSLAVGFAMEGNPELGCAVEGTETCSESALTTLYDMSMTCQVIVELVLVAIMALIFRKQIVSFFKEFKDKNTYKWFGICLGVMYAASIFYSIVLTNLGISTSSANQDAVEKCILANPFMGFLFVVVAAPIFEEMVFRLGIFRCFTNKGKKLETVGIFVTAFLFAAIHMVATFEEVFADPANPDYVTLTNDLWMLPSYLIGAFGLTIAYSKSKNFASNVILHMTWNSISFFGIIATSQITQEVAEIVIRLLN